METKDFVLGFAAGKAQGGIESLNVFQPYSFKTAGGNDPTISTHNGSLCLQRSGNYSWIFCSAGQVPSSATQLKITVEAIRLNTSYPRAMRLLNFQNADASGTYTNICDILNSAKTIEEILAQPQIITLTLSENDQIQKQTVVIDISGINEAFYVGMYLDVLTTYLYSIECS